MRTNDGSEQAERDTEPETEEWEDEIPEIKFVFIVNLVDQNH